MNGGCHTNANCINSVGSHKCVCKEGFYGNGTMCTGMYFDLFVVSSLVSVKPLFPDLSVKSPH